MKKDRFGTFLLFTGFLILAGILAFCIIFADSTIAQGKEYEAIPIPPKPAVVIIEKEVRVEVKPEDETVLSEEELYLLVCLVHAEAGNQDMIGRRLVADVVLNRMYSDQFPNTVTDVIYQKLGDTYQFSTVPKLGKEILEESDWEAVRKELRERLDPDIVFFQTKSFSKYGKKAYVHGDHYFSYAKEDK